MPKLCTAENLLTIGVLGAVACWLVITDPTSTTLSLIVGGFLGLLNLSPQKGNTP